MAFRNDKIPSLMTFLKITQDILMLVCLKRAENIVFV